MKRKINKFLFESPPDIDLNNFQNYDFENLQSTEKKSQTKKYSSADDVNQSQQRDRKKYLSTDTSFDNEKNVRTEHKSDLYDLFEEYYENLQKAEELAAELENNPGIIKETLESFADAFDSFLKFDQRQYAKYEEQKRLVYEKGFHTMFLGKNPIFEKREDGGIQFDRRIIDNFFKYAPGNLTRAVVYGVPEGYYRLITETGKGIINFWNASVEFIDEKIPIIDETCQKAADTVVNTLNDGYNFITDPQNVELMQNLMVIGMSDDMMYSMGNTQYLEKAFKNTENIFDDKKVQKELGLTKSELDLNRAVSRNYILNVMNDVDDDEDEVNKKNNNINIAQISQNLQNSMKNFEGFNNSNDSDINEDSVMQEDLNKVFNRLKGYKNYTPEDLLNNPNLINQIGDEIEGAITDFEKNKQHFDNDEIQSIQNAVKNFKKTKEIFPKIIEKFKDITQDKTVFENIKKFYKDQGIFNLNTNLDTLKNNYKNYLEQKHKQYEETLKDPLGLTDSVRIQNNFRRDLFLLRFHIKLIDTVVYFLNRFAEKILKNDKGSYRGNNFLSSIYQICLNNVNEKTIDDQKYSTEQLDLGNIAKNFNDINVISDMYNYQKGKGAENNFTDQGFFSKNNRLLSNNDKIVGFYSRQKNSDKIDMILESLRKHYNPSYFRDQEEKKLDNNNTRLQSGSFGIEEPEPIQSQELDPDFELNLKLIFTKIEIALKNAFLIDTIVLLSQKNSTKIDSKLLNNDYILYQIDISSLYNKIFNEPKLWDYIITLTNQKNSVNGEFKIEKPINMTEELKDFSIFDLREYINITPEEKITIPYENIETKTKESLDFVIESFQFLNKQIQNKKDPDLNPIQLIDLFKLSGLDFLTQNKNIFINA